MGRRQRKGKSVKGWGAGREREKGGKEEGTSI